MKRVLSITLLFVVLYQPLLIAAETIDVHVAIGKVTEVDIGEDIIKVIKGGSPDSILVEVIDHFLYVLPKSSSIANLFVTTSSGKSIALNLILSQQHDIRVEAKEPRGSWRSSYTSCDVMLIMKDLLNQTFPQQATAVKVQKVIPYKDKSLEIEHTTVYMWPGCRAHVFSVRNMTTQDRLVPVTQLTLPGLLGAAALDDTLKPQGHEGDATKVFLVTQNKDE